MHDSHSSAAPLAVQHLTVSAEYAGQRLDNYLLRHLKGVPKSHIYRIIRSGEVRVNKGRSSAEYKLQVDDVLRIPPLRLPVEAEPRHVPQGEFPVLLEDRDLLVIDKPAGVAVHGGSGINFGVIEQLRAARPEAKFLELVHRLDRETSGVLLLAKKRSALTHLHAQLRDGKTNKRYMLLVKGLWPNQRQHVRLPLHKTTTAEGERRVYVQESGLSAHTIFEQRELFRGTPWGDFTLLEADLQTGRTHQIRVHVAHLGFPIVGDEKYGDFALNKTLAKVGFKRMYLHAWRMQCTHPAGDERITLEALLPNDFERFCTALRSAVTPAFLTTPIA